jgi:hypothetical protein
MTLRLPGERSLNMLAVDIDRDAALRPAAPRPPAGLERWLGLPRLQGNLRRATTTAGSEPASVAAARTESMDFTTTEEEQITMTSKSIAMGQW